MHHGLRILRELPVCSRLVDEQEASEALPGAAEQTIV